jgi:hypothetical protein
MIYIINDGFQGSSLQITFPVQGTLCANIYVFDAVQELVECCSCPLIANALLKLSLNNNLTANPLVPFNVNSGVIKLISTLPNGTICDPTQIPTDLLSVGLEAWATHVEQPTTGNFVTVMATFLPGTPGTAEFEFLPQNCQFAHYLGTGGTGVCSCK